MTLTDIQVSDTGSIIDGVLDDRLVERIIRVAEKVPPSSDSFPHITLTGKYEYQYYCLDFWTSGFFPGSIWAVYERSLKRQLPFAKGLILQQAITWSHKLESQKDNIDTHDLGFLIMPSYKREYDLIGTEKSGAVIVQAAKSLVTRWCEASQTFKSWDTAVTKSYEFSNPKSDVLVVIDNMMNLDLLYKESIITKDESFAELATRHAETTAKYHIRDDFSTYHLVVFDAETGNRKVGLTHQGYDHESTWSRGQAWALYGFASVYQYTRKRKFLILAKKLADYFISRLENGIVYWDFDAPRPCAWDTSAATIAASGMLLICQLDQSYEYLNPALSLLHFVLERALAPADSDVILDNATIGNYRFKKDSRTNHGLVYADYYFLESGNRLLDLNIVP